MTAEMIEKRNMLRTISNASIQAAKDFKLNPDEYKVNDLLMTFIYNPDGIHSFETFAGWKYNKRIIKKGAKAYLLWGQPINKTRSNKLTGEIIQGNDDTSEAPFFPLAYLFRDDQTIEQEPRKTAQPMKQYSTNDIDI